MTPYRLTCDYSDARERRRTKADYPSLHATLEALISLTVEEWHSFTVAPLAHGGQPAPGVHIVTPTRRHGGTP